MAGSVNRVILIGNLGKDPESKTFNNGGKIVNFSLATSESWKDKEGQKQERVQWHNISITNEGIASIAERYLRKGSKVYVSGSLEHRKYQDKDGNDRYVTEVCLRPFRGELTLLDSKREEAGQGGGYDAGRDYRAPSPNQPQSGGKIDDMESEIPF